MAQSVYFINVINTHYFYVGTYASPRTEVVTNSPHSTLLSGISAKHPCTVPRKQICTKDRLQLKGLVIEFNARRHHQMIESDLLHTTGAKLHPATRVLSPVIWIRLNYYNPPETKLLCLPRQQIAGIHVHQRLRYRANSLAVCNDFPERTCATKANARTAWLQILHLAQAPRKRTRKTLSVPHADSHP